MLTSRSSVKSAVIGSDIYVLSGVDENYKWTTSFEMYSAKTNTWKPLKTIFSWLYHYSVCSFMNNIYVVGGYSKIFYHNNMYDTVYKKIFYKYEVKQNKWCQLGSLQKERSNSACTVFEGEIVVTGGYKKRNFYLKSVESYDHHENKWTY